jgi:hypothetical protein
MHSMRQPVLVLNVSMDQPVKLHLRMMYWLTLSPVVSTSSYHVVLPDFTHNELISDL